MARFNFDPVPTVAPTGAPGNDYEHIPTTPAMFGGLTAQAQEKLGQGIESVGNAGLDYQHARQHLNNEINDNDTLSWYVPLATARTEKFKQLEGQSAVNGIDDFNKDLLELRKQALAGKSLESQAALSRSLSSLQDRYMFAASNHAATQERQWHDKSAIDGARTFGDQAVFDAQNGTWDQVEQSLATSDDHVATLWRQRNPSTDPESRAVISEEVKKNRGTNVKNIVETLSNNGDPRTAQAIFDKYKAGMDGASVRAVSSHLKGLNAQLDGRTVADEETGRAPHGGIAPTPIAQVPASFVGAIKREEGFDAKPRWDVKQWTVGYGTKAAGPDERPDHAELEKRFQKEIGAAAKIVDKVNPNLDPGTRAALTSLTYNTGEAWTHSGLGAKIAAGDIAGAKPLFLQYGNVEGQPNAAIQGRRYRESQWFGQADAPAGGPTMDRGQIYDRILARTADDPLKQNAAVARMNQIFAIDRAEQTQGRVLFAQRERDEKAEAFDTGSLSTKTPLTENDFVRRYGLEEGQEKFREHADDIDLGAKVAAAASMTPEERNALIPQPQAGPGYARGLGRRAQFDTAMKQLDEQRKTDSAGLAIRRLPDVRAAYQGMTQVEGDKNSTDDQKKAARANFAMVMRDEQTRIGIDPEDRRLLPKASIETLNQRFATAADSEDTQARIGLVAGIQREAALWGNENWPDVMRQLAPATRPLIRAIAAGADPEAMTRLLRLDKTDTPTTILKEQNETTVKKLQDKVNTAMGPYQSSLLPVQRDREGKGYSALAEQLAALHVRDDKDDEETAATKAFNELVGKRFAFKDTWRMPKSAGVDPDDVQAGTGVSRTDLASLGARPPIDDVPGNTPAAVAEDMRLIGRNSTWLTAYDNSGLNLLYRFTDPEGNYRERFVKGADGRPLVVPWAELARRGQAVRQGSAEARQLQ